MTAGQGPPGDNGRMYPERATIVEVGPRDGLQSEETVLPTDAKVELIDLLSASGLTQIEVTAFVNPKRIPGLARIDVTLSNAELIVPRDDGLWPQVRKGLSYSMTVLSLSVTWLIFGLCVLLPWALVGYGGYRLVRRLFRAPPPVAGSPSA